MSMDSVFKALADPTRREILRLLGEGEQTAGQLAERLERITAMEPEAEAEQREAP